MTTPHDRLRGAFEAVAGSPLEHWEPLGNLFQYREFDALEHWIRAGDFCTEICFILEGLIRVYYIDQAGNEVNQHFYQANEAIAPISAMIKDQPCQYYIQALEPTQLMLANYKSLYSAGAESTDWLKLEIRLLQSVFVKNAKHEAQLLMGNAEQRYRWFCREYPELLERLPQYHVASFLGMTPVSLSRLRKKV
ncbi:MAG: Crp/Fnr family transcriptional regulator [Hahellaceae bacterium]|nr:Crp/Fnr family transcriptional regulator [Hahellaceae bacterium]MCP5168248.1 Crp/Fnr family transcriptional regulator [Hahellaceae bacterium]